uniref:Uncharacterized protein n=1 Tax=virus sp. ctLl75 TaxID=2828249 RepID=A0A8S5RAC8_9VIRU|nr:MAG TPA: hypothetical protein [virus sp. ctLl75]
MYLIGCSRSNRYHTEVILIRQFRNKPKVLPFFEDV